MNSKKISSRDLREKQSDVLNQIAYKGTSFLVTRNGKEVAVLISLEEFHLLQKSREYLEDERDLSDAKNAMEEVKKHGTKSLNQLVKELQIDV